MTISAQFTFWAGRKDKRTVNLELNAEVSDRMTETELLAAIRRYLKQTDPAISFCRPNQDKLKRMQP